ncbi:MAG: LysR family transcriptional regulator [Oscillospiraceae bacterium]|nr:LysR family transcriptional regulator [Oscillospiraceae bacterium]
MEIRQLRYFLAVANARSFLQAADLLYVSRQAVSKAITQLEDELNVSLFVRTQNGAMMTPAGIYFYPRATALTADFDRLKGEMLEVDRTYRSRIRLYMAFGVYDMFARPLHDYADRHYSEMDLQVHGCLDSDCEVMLADRQADVVLSFSPIANHMLVTTPILETPVKILLPKGHPLCAKETLTREDLALWPALLYTGGHNSCPWWPEETKRADSLSADLSSLFSLLKEGTGYMPIPEAMIPVYADFAERRDCAFLKKNWHIYYSTLTQAYYDALTYNLMGAMEKDIFKK